MKNIPLFKVFMSDKAPEAAAEVLKSGYIGQGEIVEKFESGLRGYLNSDYVLSLNSCTSALHLGIHLLKAKNDDRSNWPGLRYGDEVLCTPLTCTATNWPVLANGLRIKWVDVDPETLGMDLDDLARKITPSTKVILLVHWGGYPCDLDRVREIQLEAEKLHGFKPSVIEDCAHAFGTTFKKSQLPEMGNICCYSFQAIKHLTSVDGGALVLPHQELFKRGKLLRWYGIDRDTNTKDFRCEDDIPEWGFKFHMNDVCAAVGLENLKEIEPVLKKHIDNAAFYNEALAGTSGVTLLQSELDRQAAYWQYTMFVDRRDDFMRKMAEHGIAVSRVHERNDKHLCVREFKTQLPSLERVVKDMICIPVGWWVTEEDREYIVGCIKEGW